MEGLPTLYRLCSSDAHCILKLIKARFSVICDFMQIFQSPLLKPPGMIDGKVNHSY